MDKFLSDHPNCWAIVWSPTSKLVEVLNQVNKHNIATSYITPADVPDEIGLAQNDQLIILRPAQIPYGIITKRTHDVLDHINKLERRIALVRASLNEELSDEALESKIVEQVVEKLEDMTKQRDGVINSLERAKRDYDEQLSNIIAENTALRSDAAKLAVVSVRLEELARSVTTPGLAQALRDLLNT